MLIAQGQPILGAGVSMEVDVYDEDFGQEQLRSWKEVSIGPIGERGYYLKLQCMTRVAPTAHRLNIYITPTYIYILHIYTTTHNSSRFRMVFPLPQLFKWAWITLLYTPRAQNLSTVPMGIVFARKKGV